MVDFDHFLLHSSLAMIRTEDEEDSQTHLPLLIRLCNNPLSRILVGNAIPLTQRIHHLLALDAQPRFQAVCTVV
jgi:hypothetical protein